MWLAVVVGGAALIVVGLFVVALLFAACSLASGCTARDLGTVDEIDVAECVSAARPQENRRIA